jgi:hypothetical protein
MLKTHKLKPTEIVCYSKYLQSVLLVGNVNENDGFESIYEPEFLDRKNSGVTLAHIIKDVKPDELFDILGLYLPNKELSILISACVAKVLLKYEHKNMRLDFIQDVARFVNIENNFYMALSYIDAPLRDYLRQLQMGVPAKWQNLSYPLAYIALISDKNNVIDPDQFMEKLYDQFIELLFSDSKVMLNNIAQDHLPYVPVGDNEKAIYRAKGGRPSGPRGPYKKRKDGLLEQSSVQKAFEESQSELKSSNIQAEDKAVSTKPAKPAKSKPVEIKPEIREASKVMGVFAKTKAVDVKNEDLERFRFLVNRFCTAKSFFNDLVRIDSSADVLLQFENEACYKKHLDYYKDNNLIVLFAHVYHLLSVNKVHYQYHEIIKQMQAYRKEHSLDISIIEQKVLLEFFKYLKKNI